jgi:hypothetical protein
MGFIWPASGAVMAGFDERATRAGHRGKAGDPVLAAADGRVVYAGAGLRGYGNLIILKHNNTYLTAYAHNQSLLVKEDQAVKKGQKIAEMGSTDADRVKLHFEVRRQGKPVDPRAICPRAEPGRSAAATRRVCRRWLFYAFRRRQPAGCGDGVNRGIDSVEADAGHRSEQAELRAVEVPTAMHGQRLDKVLAELVPEFSRSYLQQLLAQGAAGRGRHQGLRQGPLGDRLRWKCGPTQQARPSARGHGSGCGL